MPELKQDKFDIKFNKKKGVAVVKRTIIEEYDAEEYIRSMKSMELQVERLNEDAKTRKDVIRQFKRIILDVEKQRDKEIELSKEEVAKYG